MLFGQEKVSFLNTPTPLERLPRISEELGLDFYIKRDDLTNLGVGGNKLRKLEYLLADAKRQGATTLLTIKKETGSWRWAALAFLLPTLLGILLCILFNAIFGRWA